MTGSVLPLQLATTEWVLMATVFTVAVWNTSVGPTGGITFATMAAVLPPTAALAVQSVIEGSSSVLRVWLLRKRVDRSFFSAFLIGGLAGYALGLATRLIAAPSENALQVVMGASILLATWVPLHRLAMGGSVPGCVGALASFLSLFVGGQAPLVASAIETRRPEHEVVIATLTACLAYQHAMRALLFGALGFSFAAYGRLVALLLLAAVAGTLVGHRLLVNVPPALFKPVFRVLVTGLGVGVLYKGLTGTG